MYHEDGPPLRLDGMSGIRPVVITRLVGNDFSGQLCFSYHYSAFHSLPYIRCSLYGVSRILSLSSCSAYMGEETPTKRKHYDIRIRHAERDVAYNHSTWDHRLGS